MSEWWHDTVLGAFETIILVGGVMTAIGLGIKRIYNVARSVEKILEFTIEERKQREAVAANLADHIRTEEQRDEQLDKQILQMAATIQEIGREVRPNGGSSMKDVLNHTAERVGDIHSRVSVLEEWKRIKG